MEKILVVAPLTRKLSPAMHRAVAYGRQTGAVVHLLRFDYYAPIDFSRRIFGAEVADRARRDYLEDGERVLAAQAQELSDKGVLVRKEVVWAPRLHEAVITKTRELRPDLVIKDIESEADGVLTRAHPVDWKLMRLCPAPLMLVHARSHVRPQRIAAAIDVMVPPEEAGFNDEIIRAAREIASISDACLDLVSVFSYTPIETYGAGFVADVYEIMEDSHREALNAFAAAHNIAGAHIQRMTNASAATGIVDAAARLSTDLIVLGSTYHNGWHRLMFGTTAESLLRRLNCDALLLKPQGFEQLLSEHMRLDAGSRQPTRAAVA